MQLRRLLALSALAAFPLVAQPNRITVAIDAHRTTLVRGQVHPLARPQFDQGVVEDAFPLNNLSLTLGPSAEQQAALGSFLVSLQDPNSADYQKWLTPQEFADRFGPSPADYAQVAAWLEGEGFTIQTRVPSRNWIAFSGTAGQARRAFGADIHRYQVNGEPHFANANDPSVPEALAGLVAGFRGLHDFRLHPQHHTVHTAYTSGSGTHYLAPDDVATIYSVAGLYSRGFDGTGQKLVVAGQTDVNIADMENFRTMFGLPANDPQLMLVPGLPDPGISSSDIIEANLDLEWSGAVARKAAIFYVYSTNVLDAVQYAIAQNLAPVISLSYGGCEAGGGAQQLQLLAQQANA
ncbi:MAG TPA: protease pro-enzyme activation domain-containing protein, partial [Candidatus Sulfopaludibacter sp.]|nr:protease pro-enzyme activation domain-containing protein [Candidatus Sulfopaludibacter sp.]